MPQADPRKLAEKRQIEDELLVLGEELEALREADGWKRERIRRLVGPARQAGISVRDVARLSGLSTQTLHTWMRDLMRPVPDAHLRRSGPVPRTLEQAVLRVMGEEPEREWRADEVLDRFPAGWPVTSVGDAEDAMERLARGHMIWRAGEGYRVAPAQE